MKELISDLIRKYAAGIEEDDTPTEAELKKETVMSKPNLLNPLRDSNKGSETVERKYVPPPKEKPPRRKKGLKKFDYKETRNDYMEDYRLQGKDLETGNRYIKKLKKD